LKVEMAFIRACTCNYAMHSTVFSASTKWPNVSGNNCEGTDFCLHVLILQALLRNSTCAD